MNTLFKRPVVWSIIGTAVLVAVWAISSVAADDIYYPPLPEVIAGVVEFWFTGPGAEDLASSMRNVGLGFIIGAAAAVLLGLVIGQLWWVRTALTPGLEFIRAIPATALIPFAMVIFGLGDTMKVIIIALGAFFPILLTVIDGARSVSQEAIDTAKAYQINGLSRQLRVIIPSVLPRAVAGIRIAIPLALIVMVTSEMTGSSVGIGTVLIEAQDSFNQVSVWAVIVLLGLLGMVLNGLFWLVERRILGWHRRLHHQEGS
ncbi:ABC transporter permease [Parenemella sanctibonifatiensis]|uniref:ABC transporter permease n=1 Tax=Parenemella sanctibonifatiensis TaxID=2016505 RepID=A0A255EHW0_9ACTN|nr:ABC transporter permease subunit [Parenemella sanctibonifatiensis]OYN91106.1 ABC transporter permease [Parenemella sanctibonifatiensis]